MFFIFSKASRRWLNSSMPARHKARRARKAMGMEQKHKKLRPKPVTVEWMDSTTHAGWVRLDTAEGVDMFRDACTCKSMGTIIYRDEKVLVIAGTVGLDADGYIDQVCDVMTIPARCVLRVRRR